MADIFLSYRRQDSQSATGRLGDRLEAHVGPARVFRDHHSIVAGEDFAEAIRRAIEGSTVVLVVIGPHWLTTATPGGQRRLDEPGDFVRLEIEFSLETNVPLVPVLVEGAVMPSAEQLPPSLAAFSRCQAVELSETRWRYDAQRLIETLQGRFAIEALGTDPEEAGSADAPRWMRSAARLAIDLLDLATHPTRLILRRQTGQAIDHIRAFLFLVGALAAGHAMLFSVYGVVPTVPRGVVGDLLHAANLTVWGVVFGLLVVTLLLIVLAVAWRLAGTRVEFRQLSIVMAYVAGGLWLGTCLGAFVLVLGIQFDDELAVTRMVELAWPAHSSLPAGSSWHERLAAAEAVMRPVRQSGPAFIALALASLIWFTTGCWLMVAWQGFSLSVGVSRWRALLATTIWLALLGAVGSMIAAALAQP